MQEERRSLKFNPAGLLAIAGLVAFDQISKYLVRTSLPEMTSKELIPGLLWLTHVENTGVAFGLGKGFSLFFSFVGVVLLVFVYLLFREQRDRWEFRTAGILVLSGAAGNIVDRITRGSVTDFIDVGFWPVFNFADVFIASGIAVILFFYLRDELK